MHAEVILPVHLGEKTDRLTYKIPAHLQTQIHVGTRVQVPLRKSLKMGIVASVHERELTFTTKEIVALWGEESLLLPWQLALAEWMAKYYQAPLYKVIKLMIPEKIWTKKAPVSPSEKPEEFLNSENHEKKFTAAQQATFDGILKSQAKKFLIHGVTGSGKTEIYLRLVKHTAAQGKQCILLVPEISLTPQLLDYFQATFGDHLAKLHSRLSLKEREKQWWKIQKGEARVIIGSRSALFAPVQNLGMILIDEEHEWTYKQETTPRYHARDVAFKIGELTDTKVILGSATPSIETYYGCEQGWIEKFELKTRIDETSKLPHVHVVDLRQEIRGKNFSIFSTLLQEKLAETLAQNHQALLFLNRRGNASSVLCRECGYVCRCKACEVSLTHHRLANGLERLICHHCNAVERVPERCPQCSGIAIKLIGIGTQRIEQELQLLFPKVRILRADKDTTQKKESFEGMYKAFKQHKADVLIGTQMIGKGLDFPNVTLVGIILADVGLHIPDFRSSERTFQILTQVAGRAGRGKYLGEVVIQTYNPEDKTLKHATLQEYEPFYKEEIAKRKALHYPPWSKMIKFSYISNEQKNCSNEARDVETKLKELTQTETIHSAPALIPKRQNKYYWNVFIQGENPEKLLESLLKNKPLSTGWRIDVDPMTMG